MNECFFICSCILKLWNLMLLCAEQEPSTATICVHSVKLVICGYFSLIYSFFSSENCSRRRTEVYSIPRSRFVNSSCSPSLISQLSCTILTAGPTVAIQTVTNIHRAKHDQQGRPRTKKTGIWVVQLEICQGFHYPRSNGSHDIQVDIHVQNVKL